MNLFTIPSFSGSPYKVSKLFQYVGVTDITCHAFIVWLIKLT